MQFLYKNMQCIFGMLRSAMARATNSTCSNLKLQQNPKIKSNYIFTCLKKCHCQISHPSIHFARADVIKRTIKSKKIALQWTSKKLLFFKKNISNRKSSFFYFVRKGLIEILRGNTYQDFMSGVVIFFPNLTKLPYLFSYACNSDEVPSILENLTVLLLF